ncbi:hypothetical protein A9Q87_04990 [Flavobacteriales bacterium 34_180_T64]|nr:hypothetical protein A9Q87_04990 [Flavobacteriales bacterium 34_180_T64]
MKTFIKSTAVLIILSTLVFTSCRTEETESILPPTDETIEANSLVADLMLRTATNDGSNDNIIDNSNCFNIQLPITVIVNGLEFIVYSEDDFEAIEDVFDEDEDDIDDLEIVFPITIILTDFSEVILNNYTEFYAISNNCNGENENDDDIECIDFQYPITASVFNSDDEIIETITINTDNDLYDFIESIDINDIITINFPIIVILSDGSQISIMNLTELATVIENAEDDCDEDDDYDYNDDDCDDCSPGELIALLIGCADWEVDKLENNNTDFDDLYAGYLFNFFNDGTLSVYWNTTTVYGTWSADGSGNNIIVTISIPSLQYCNNDWQLHEIDLGSSETKIDLRVGNEDRLRYENENCN